MSTTEGWQPRIVAFLCNWCSYTGADLAGISRISVGSPSVSSHPRSGAAGRVDPTFVVQGRSELGADGVIVSGCHPGDCHYQEGNYKALRRVHLLPPAADWPTSGSIPNGFKLVWVSASEGDQLGGDRPTTWPRRRSASSGTTEVAEAHEFVPELDESDPERRPTPGTSTSATPRAKHEARPVLGLLLRGLRDRSARHPGEDPGRLHAAFDIVFWPVAVDFKVKDVEAMADDEIDLCLFNGAVRNSDNLNTWPNSCAARRRCWWLSAPVPARGASLRCRTPQPGPATMDWIYRDSPSTDNPDDHPAPGSNGQPPSTATIGAP